MRNELVFGLLALALAAVSGVVADWVRRHADRLGLLHHPNQRSSHARLTPHGGGIGIVLGGTLAGLVLAWGEPMGAQVGPVLWLSLVIGFVGLWDDVQPAPARWRLLVQFLACSGALVGLGTVGDGAVGLLILVLAAMWWINLFNFMDGIDGLAGMQAVFMLIAGAVLMMHFTPEATGQVTWRWVVLLSAASTGFLWLNWPPAKIFMGDVGSTYLGFLLFFLGWMTVDAGLIRYSTWMTLGALFVCDATSTLLVRVCRGERWFEAHRSHVYQLLARHWHSHRSVTLLALAINLAVMAPAAWSTMRWPEWEWWVVGIVYSLSFLLLIAARWKISPP